MSPTLVLNAGLADIVQRMLGLSSEWKYAHWGSGVVPVGPPAGTQGTDTTLYGPETEARVAAVGSRVTGPAPNVTNDTVQWVVTLIAAAAKTITNAGLHNDPAAGILTVKGDHAGVPLQQNEGIQYTFQVQFKRA